MQIQLESEKKSLVFFCYVGITIGHGRAGCIVFDVHWTETETDVNETKFVFFIPTKKVEQGRIETRFRSFVCGKDVNALVLILENIPRKLF